MGRATEPYFAEQPRSHPGLSGHRRVRADRFALPEDLLNDALAKLPLAVPVPAAKARRSSLSTEPYYIRGASRAPAQNHLSDDYSVAVESDDEALVPEQYALSGLGRAQFAQAPRSLLASCMDSVVWAREGSRSPCGLPDMDHLHRSTLIRAPPACQIRYADPEIDGAQAVLVLKSDHPHVLTNERSRRSSQVSRAPRFSKLDFTCLDYDVAHTADVRDDYAVAGPKCTAGI